MWYSENLSFYLKTVLAPLLGNFCENWATFNSSIWSHYLLPTIVIFLSLFSTSLSRSLFLARTTSLSAFQPVWDSALSKRLFRFAIKDVGLIVGALQSAQVLRRDDKDIGQGEAVSRIRRRLKFTEILFPKLSIFFPFKTENEVLCRTRLLCSALLSGEIGIVLWSFEWCKWSFVFLLQNGPA